MSWTQVLLWSAGIYLVIWLVCQYAAAKYRREFDEWVRRHPQG